MALVCAKALGLNTAGMYRVSEKIYIYFYIRDLNSLEKEKKVSVSLIFLLSSGRHVKIQI